MYLPFESTAAIFVGGLIRWLLEARLSRRKAAPDERVRAENMGTLLSSGFIAGESLMAVILAFVVIGQDFFPFLTRLRAAVTPSGGPSFFLSLLVYPALVYLLVFLPLRKMREGGLPSVKAE
jgi:hypothetical protein